MPLISARPLARAAALSAPVVSGARGDDLVQRYAAETAAMVRTHLPWAVLAFLATYAAVAVFEVQRWPERMPLYVGIYLIGALWCALAVALTRAPTVSSRRSLVVTTLLGVALVANTTTYHILVRGEAEVLALGNVYLMIGFLTAFPWGGWPQLAVAGAACAGLAVGLGTTVDASVSRGILLAGLASLAALSVASAILTNRYRFSLFVARDELKAAKEAAEAASHARRDFVASVSHDLRTPVNIIFGMADMALDVAVTTEQRDFVQTIRRSAGELNALLADLLDFSKMDAGVVDLRPRRFALRPWLATTLESHTRTADAKGLTLREEVDAALPEMLSADPDRLRQVLVNLVGNALKFTERGTVTVRLRRQGATLRCEVADTGIGIAAEETRRLFQPFAQAAATMRSHAGSGLGLAICRRLVEQMGGRIGVESTPGAGSTFWFTLPLAG